MSGLRVLVCGGRNFHDVASVAVAMERVCFRSGGLRYPTLLIHGDARGADRLGESWAARHGVPYCAFPADWERDGKAAGFIRNQRMIDEGKPDLVVAFPGGRGTADMVARAEKAGIEILRVGGAS